MKEKNKEKDIVHIDASLSTPIYKQIVESVIAAIENGLLQKGNALPSVNSIAEKFGTARGSIFKSYDELKSLGIIESIPGKGYFVLNKRLSVKRNIFLMMSTFNSYREEFFNAFVERLKNNAAVDLYFHHHNIDVFESLIQNHSQKYNSFVIMPEIHKRTKQIISTFKGKKLYLLDTGFEEFSKRYPGVFINYDRNIQDFLRSIQARINPYKRIILLFSANMRNYDLVKGFENYFKSTNQTALVIKETEAFTPKQHDFCLVMDDPDLVRIILYAKSKDWTVGKDIGIVSYNESLLKSIIAVGVSTIGPDYKSMGYQLADLILDSKDDSIENQFLFIDRKSF